ncbi:bile acid:sodium symporter family protein [Kordiimonas pumila]|uniref:Bile acid:sodium symporter family protein n=1 Tax=Kordiimonas pumila TaxID=2161677 RepID=A0ABV7D4E2_9PROT|nr:bile acid:sodium symporter family protein [Kordiimonas pumila]
MGDAQINFINTAVVPIGLIAIMFSLGLSLTLKDFKRVGQQGTGLGLGVLGQLILLPLLGLSVVAAFHLPPEMAVGLMILAICPGGVTSNAIAFAVRANVALSVSLTVISSLVTIVTIPILMGVILDHYLGSGDAPPFSPLNTFMKLFQMTVIPVALGMVLRRFLNAFADRLVIWLRPVALIVLVSVIGFSLYASADLLLDNITTAGPAAFVLNISALLGGYLLARAGGLNEQDRMTVSIEVGVQNATVATFLTLTVLDDMALAITPTLYGLIMILNTLVVPKLLTKAWKQAA